MASYENRFAAIEADLKAIHVHLAAIKDTMATKAWVLAQTFVLLGGTAALVKLLH